MFILCLFCRLNHNDWIKQYETLAEMVVPRSSNVLSEDQDSYLCNVTLFRKAVDDFRHKARENKFIVRDFQYNEEEMKAEDTVIQGAVGAARMPGRGGIRSKEKCTKQNKSNLKLQSTRSQPLNTEITRGS